MTRLFDLDFQLLADAFLMMIAIFALFLVASYFLFNPVREMLEKRKDKIAGDDRLAVGTDGAGSIVGRNCFHGKHFFLYHCTSKPALLSACLICSIWAKSLVSTESRR